MRFLSLLGLGAWSLVALTAAGGPSEPRPATTADATVRAPAPVASGLPYDAIAAAARGRDFAAAARLLLPTAGGTGAEARQAQLVLGLVARACGRDAEALRWLGAAAEPGGALEDWRLFALAEAAASSRQPAVAEQALQRLLGDLPASPLRPRALQRLAEIAWANAQADLAVATIERAAGEQLEGPEAIALQTLLWRIGTQTGPPELGRRAARWLLVEAPLEASRLGVVDTLRPARGAFDWSTALTPPELVRRAERLLDLTVLAGADQSLAAVPPAARGLGWTTQRARLLTAQHRGAEALRLLTPLAPTAPEEVAAVAWQRAAGATEAAALRAGRPNPPAELRARLRAVAVAQLQQVIATRPGTELARRARQALFAALVDDGRSEEAIAVLRELLAADPGDITGARPLWQRGWQQYRGRDDAGALRTWRQLAELYPQTSSARAGGYWSALACDRTGDRAQATALLQAVAAGPTRDFYARCAAGRLAAPVPAAAPVDEGREPWPADAGLDRARLLSDLGLDELALAEIDLREGPTPSRAGQALRGLVLTRADQHREGLRQLRLAFPVLATAYQTRAPLQAFELFYPLAYDTTIRAEARAQGLPAALLFAVVHQESAFDAAARSRSGARGLMQLMPGTGRGLARQLGLPYSSDRLDQPAYSVHLGASYLRQMLRLFDGRVELALAAYNAGPGRIQGLWRQAGPRPELDLFVEGLTLDEPRDYVKRILVLADGYRALYPELAAGG